MTSYFLSMPPKRVIRYKLLAKSIDVNADELYLLNARISESMYLPLQTLEITLRNSINLVLSEEFGTYWFDKPNLLNIPHQYKQIGSAKSDLVKDGKQIEADRIIAQLMLGFWISFFGSNYEDLWRSTLYKIVQKDHRKGQSRKRFSGALTPLRKLRNRIAHHECILEWNALNSYHQILTVLEYISPYGKDWVANHATFKSIYNEHKNILTAIQTHKK